MPSLCSPEFHTVLSGTDYTRLYCVHLQHSIRRGRPQSGSPPGSHMDANSRVPTETSLPVAAVVLGSASRSHGPGGCSIPSIAKSHYITSSYFICCSPEEWSVGQGLKCLGLVHRFRRVSCATCNPILPARFRWNQTHSSVITPCEPLATISLPPPISALRRERPSEGSCVVKGRNMFPGLLTRAASLPHPITPPEPPRMRLHFVCLSASRSAQPPATSYRSRTAALGGGRPCLFV